MKAPSMEWLLWAAENRTNRAALDAWLGADAETQAEVTPEDCCFRYLVNCPACGMLRIKSDRTSGFPCACGCRFVKQSSI